MKYTVKSVFLNEENESVLEASSPEEALTFHIGKLPFEDGLDYPDDFWNVVVPVGEGTVRPELELKDENSQIWIWPIAKGLNWPLDVSVSAI